MSTRTGFRSPSEIVLTTINGEFLDYCISDDLLEEYMNTPVELPLSPKEIHVVTTHAVKQNAKCKSLPPHVHY